MAAVVVALRASVCENCVRKSSVHCAIYVLHARRISQLCINIGNCTQTHTQKWRLYCDKIQSTMTTQRTTATSTNTQANTSRLKKKVEIKTEMPGHRLWRIKGEIAFASPAFRISYPMQGLLYNIFILFRMRFPLLHFKIPYFLSEIRIYIYIYFLSPSSKTRVFVFIHALIFTK